MMLDIVQIFFLAHMAFTDMSRGRIKNSTVIVGILTAFVIRIIGGFEILQDGLIGGAAGLAVGYCFWKLHVFKAGDAKMLWMIGNFSGFSGFFEAFAAIMVANGLFSYFLMMKEGVVKERLARIYRYFKSMIILRTPYAYTLQKNDQVRLPMAPGALVGIVLLTALKAAKIITN